MNAKVNNVKCMLVYHSSTGKAYKMRRSAFCSNYSPVIVSDYMSGKMFGIPSISTSVLENPICQKRRNMPGSICQDCFAVNTANRYKALAKNLVSNLELLTDEILPLDILPRFIPELSSIARFESFGDLASVNQAVNYLNIAAVNPGIKFAIWTKNPWFMAKAVEMVGKPDNIRVIYSAPFVNKEIPLDAMQRVFPFIDAVFTVYDENYIDENSVEINCGGRDCIVCRNCYDRENYYRDIREELK